ncbi:MAG TPA: hypothetical protein VNR39_14080 [Pseudolabrys sp.]|nr:hypothetical protein [Pseudolabrys sp.]
MALAVGKNKEIKEVVLNAGEYPTELFLYRFRQANALFGMPSHVDTLDWTISAINSHDEMVAFERKYGGQFATTIRPQPIEFGRMLAKIGHSYATASLGLGSFRPLALEVILGRSENISHTVGSHPDLEEPIVDAGHVLSLEYRVKPFQKEALILVQIRLFASLWTPTYHVVVGEVKDVEHVRVLLKQMQNASEIEIVRD